MHVMYCMYTSFFFFFTVCILILEEGAKEIQILQPKSSMVDDYIGIFLYRFFYILKREKLSKRSRTFIL